jgi:hypothetical protein
LTGRRGSEFLRPEDRNDKVGQAGKGDEPDDDGFHGRGMGRGELARSAHFLAEPGEGAGGEEERHREDDEEKVAHEVASRLIRNVGRAMGSRVGGGMVFVCMRTA